jgi:hypothetical protein
MKLRNAMGQLYDTTIEQLSRGTFVTVRTLSVGKARQIFAAFEGDADYLSRQSRVNKVLSKREALSILMPKDRAPDETVLSPIVARHIVKELGFDFLRQE